MVHQRITTAGVDGLDDIGSLGLTPMKWRIDARSARGRSMITRPWHEENIQIPLQAVSVDPERVLYWDNDAGCENSLQRISYMMAHRVIPLAVVGGNTIRNVVDRLDNTETSDEVGYSMSRIYLARRVLEQLQITRGERKGHHHSANLRINFRYIPPEDEALDTLVEILRERGER